jgi:UDP-N-acetylmuramoylalanine--D-glutamate ligase
VIGEAADDIAAALVAADVAVERAGTLESAIAAAAAAAAPAEVVLLSPACASFDQFRDFEARGDRFRALVEELS